MPSPGASAVVVPPRVPQPEMPKRWDSASARRSALVSARRAAVGGYEAYEHPDIAKAVIGAPGAFYDAWHYSREEAERQSGAYRYARSLGESGAGLSAFTRSSRFERFGNGSAASDRYRRLHARDGRFAIRIERTSLQGRSTRHLSRIHERTNRPSRRPGRTPRCLSRGSNSHRSPVVSNAATSKVVSSRLHKPARLSQAARH